MLSHLKILISPNKVYFYDVLPSLESGETYQQNGKLSDCGSDDDREAYGWVAIILKESHQESKSSKQHHMNINDHWNNVCDGIVACHLLNSYWDIDLEFHLNHHF